jgi:hypothetical protein
MPLLNPSKLSIKASKFQNSHKFREKLLKNFHPNQPIANPSPPRTNLLPKPTLSTLKPLKPSKNPVLMPTLTLESLANSSINALFPSENSHFLHQILDDSDEDLSSLKKSRGIFQPYSNFGGGGYQVKL